MASTGLASPGRPQAGRGQEGPAEGVGAQETLWAPGAPLKFSFHWFDASAMPSALIKATQKFPVGISVSASSAPRPHSAEGRRVTVIGRDHVGRGGVCPRV